MKKKSKIYFSLSLETKSSKLRNCFVILTEKQHNCMDTHYLHNKTRQVILCCTSSLRSHRVCHHLIFFLYFFFHICLDDDLGLYLNLSIFILFKIYNVIEADIYGFCVICICFLFEIEWIFLVACFDGEVEGWGNGGGAFP